jgi:hypothetical protein
MPKGKYDINGVVVDFGRVKAFHKTQRPCKCKPYGGYTTSSDFGITFVFHGGAKKTVWWFGRYDDGDCRNQSYERDEVFKRLSNDFDVRIY